MVELREALSGLATLHQDLGLFDFADVIVRTNYRKLKGVRLLCGGVAGNDLSYAAFVGPGMLTAAILGEKVVPCSRTIMKTIQELNQGDINYGIFVICQDNSKLFNFKLAADLAGSDCSLRVKVLTVGNSCERQEDMKYFGEMILMIKILGAMAEKGVFYNDIFRFYNNIIKSFKTVSLVESETRYQLNSEAEDDIFNHFNQQSHNNLNVINNNNKFVVLINTHKATSKLEQFAMVKRILERFNDLGQTILRIYLTTAGTTRLLSGAYLTILHLKVPQILEYLDTATSVLGWNQIIQHLPEVTVKNEISSHLKKIGTKEIDLKGPGLDQQETRILVTVMQFVLESLDHLEATLNTMDKIRSKGNMGSRLKLACYDVKNRVKNNKFNTNYPYAVFKKLSIILPELIGGIMGSVFGVIFESGAEVFGELPKERAISQEVWMEVLRVATKSVENLCSEEMETKTLYHPLNCFYNNTLKYSSSDNILEALKRGASFAEDSVAATMDDDGKGPDPGAYAIAVMIRGLVEGLELMINSSSLNLIK